MTRFKIGRNADLLLAEQSVVAPAVLLSLAAGLNLFFWLRARRGPATWPVKLGQLGGSLAAGLLVIGGPILIAHLIHPGFGWACAAIALVGVLLSSYVWGTRGTPARSALVLLLLRLLAITVLLVLYLEPQLKFIDRSARQSKLLMIIDESGSMKINDGPKRLSRLEWVKSELLGARGALAHLEEDFQLELYAFADELRAIEPGDVGDLEPAGPATAFATTVGEACAKCDKLATTGVLVFTDGIDNSGHDPVAAIARSGLPVFPVAVGSKVSEKGDFKDIAVERVDYERHVAANNKVELTAHVKAIGLNGRRVSVVFEFGGKEKDRQPLVLDNFPGTQAVTLSFTPAKPTDGEPVPCSIKVEEDPEERLTDNNQKEFDIVVTEPSIRVLLIEGLARPEYKWLLRTLQLDPNVSLLALVQLREGVFKQQGVKDIELRSFPTNFKVLKKFHVVIFGDIDHSFFTDKQLQNVEKFVSEGRGFLMLGGQRSLGPGGYAAAGTDAKGPGPVAKVLPVQLGDEDIGQVDGEFRLRLTADGATHEIFAGITDFFAVGKKAPGRRLPPFLGCTRVGEKKPGAVVLAVHPRQPRPGRAPGAADADDADRLIVAAVQPYGNGRAMVFTADTTWQWYTRRDLCPDPPYVKFWGQAIRWLAGPEFKEKQDEPGLTAYTDKRRYEPGSTVRIYARVRDQHGQATNQASVSAILRGPAGPPVVRQVPYLRGTTGKYEVDYEPPTPGKYEMLVKAATLDGPLDSKTLDFQVGQPNLEFDELDLDDRMLKRIADQTDGKYVTLVGLHNFISKLKSVEQANRTMSRIDVWDDESIHVFRQDLSPYLVAAFLVFSALVTAEWVLRRRNQLV